MYKSVSASLKALILELVAPNCFRVPDYFRAGEKEIQEVGLAEVQRVVLRLCQMYEAREQMEALFSDVIQFERRQEVTTKIMKDPSLGKDNFQDTYRHILQKSIELLQRALLKLEEIAETSPLYPQGKLQFYNNEDLREWLQKWQTLISNY